MPDQKSLARDRQRRILAPGGEFVFSQVQSIQVNVPPENVVAMLDTACEFGTCPIS